MGQIPLNSEKKALPLIQNEHLREYLKWKLFPSFDSITNEAFQDIAIFPPVLFQWLDQQDYFRRSGEKI